MADVKGKSTLVLAHRLNEIMKLQTELEIEYTQIVYELWDRIPSLKEDVNIQPNVLKREANNGKIPRNNK